MVSKYAGKRVREIARENLESFGLSRTRNESSEPCYEIRNIHSPALYDCVVRIPFRILYLLTKRYIVSVLSTELSSEISRDFPYSSRDFEAVSRPFSRLHDMACDRHGRSPVHRRE
jgi:hypothetical protein